MKQKLTAGGGGHEGQHDAAVLEQLRQARLHVRPEHGGLQLGHDLNPLAGALLHAVRAEGLAQVVVQDGAPLVLEVSVRAREERHQGAAEGTWSEDLLHGLVGQAVQDPLHRGQGALIEHTLKKGLPARGKLGAHLPH